MATAPSKILLIDQDETLGLTLQSALRPAGIELVQVKETVLALDALKTGHFPVIVCEIQLLSLPEGGLMQTIQNQTSPSVLILTTGMGSVEGAVEAYKKGAFDYICKPFQLEELTGIFTRALEHSKMISQPIIKIAIPTTPEPHPRLLVGRSPKMIEIYKRIAKAGLSSSNVLISGETGTGKELVARAIHENSDRSSGPFVAINCGALSETLLESELFGYVKGAFTGATLDRKGLIEEANSGTLFLDEIGDLSTSLQVKLLRVLQEKEVRPLGSNQVRKVDIRIVSATHRNLSDLVTTERFRQDLFFRLNVVRIDLPPLRERLDDLPVLTRHFLITFNEKSKKSVTEISPEVIKLFQSHAWPGNIRELENVIERAVSLADGSKLRIEDLPEEMRFIKLFSSEDTYPPTLSLEAIEKLHIQKVLKSVAYNRSKASQILGIDRTTLYRKALKYQIDLNHSPLS